MQRQSQTLRGQGDRSYAAETRSVRPRHRIRAPSAPTSPPPAAFPAFPAFPTVPAASCAYTSPAAIVHSSSPHEVIVTFDESSMREKFQCELRCLYSRFGVYI
jgi:hypothetical protein